MVSILRRHSLNVVGAALAFAYCPAIAGGESSPRWMIAAIAPWLLLNKRPEIDSRAIGLLAFVLWTSIASLWSPQFYVGSGFVFQLCIAAGWFLLGAECEDPRSFYRAMAIALCIAQIAGLFFGDFGAEGLALIVVALAAYEEWLFFLPTFATVLFAHSRTAWLAVALAALIGLWGIQRRIFIAAVILFGVVFCWKAWIGGSPAITDRLDMWRDALSSITLFGHGTGSTYIAFPNIATRYDMLALATRPEHLHNDFIEVLFEQGIFGFGLLLIALARLLWKKRGQTEFYILVAVCGLMLAAFPLHKPVTLVLAAFAVGGLCRSNSVQRRAMPSRAFLGRSAMDTNVPGEFGADLPVSVSISV